MWKRLTHSNILPLLGVTVDNFQLISNWMSGGHLLGYVKNNFDADRIGLVCVPPIALVPCLPQLPAFRRRQGPLLPPLLQYHSWGP
jgi:hypothetical protein